MKTIHVLLFCLVITLMNANKNQTAELDLNILKGTWQLDMTPGDKTDSNFAKMTITKINKSTFEGEFYRDGVKIRNGRINTQLGVIYAALISRDGTGAYNTTFYYKNGILYGTTHAIDRDFLSVWTATKAD